MQSVSSVPTLHCPATRDDGRNYSRHSKKKSRLRSAVESIFLFFFFLAVIDKKKGRSPEHDDDERFINETAVVDETLFQQRRRRSIQISRSKSALDRDAINDR